VFVEHANPYIQQWNLNVQRELPGDMVFEIAYLGSKGTRLIWGESGVVLNQLPPEFQKLGTSLQDLVPNPFFGIITNPTSTLSRSMVTRGQLLRPFPQYTGVSAFRKPFGFSTYHALTLRVDKRFANGISFLGSYTKSKLIDDVSTTVNFLGQASSQQNAYDRRAERAVSTQDVAQRLVISYVYELPIGRGKPFLNNFSSANWLASGWQINGISTFQSGIPLVIVSGQNNAGIFSPGQRLNNLTGRSARITGGKTSDRIAQWFDTSVFTFAPAFTFGNAPRTLPDARNPGTRLFDISIFKNNYLREGKFNAQFRAEFFNAFNTTQFNGPGTNRPSGDFGVISGASGPRQIQLALKLMF
ncbi:MAG TPA: carboxypeptidase regulatory-like domain-containing protein, partial [Acidobacteriota bacterium]